LQHLVLLLLSDKDNLLPLRLFAQSVDLFVLFQSAFLQAEDLVSLGFLQFVMLVVFVLKLPLESHLLDPDLGNLAFQILDLRDLGVNLLFHLLLLLLLPFGDIQLPLELFLLGSELILNFSLLSVRDAALRLHGRGFCRLEFAHLISELLDFLLVLILHKVDKLFLHLVLLHFDRFEDLLFFHLLPLELENDRLLALPP